MPKTRAPSGVGDVLGCGSGVAVFQIALQKYALQDYSQADVEVRGSKCGTEEGRRHAQQ